MKNSSLIVHGWIVVLCVKCTPIYAGTSNWIGLGSDFNSAANWDAGVPNDVAAFDAAGPQEVTVSASITVKEITFAPTAPDYTISIADSKYLQFNGSGITNNSSGVQTIETDNSSIIFLNAANAGECVISNNSNGSINFLQSSNAGGAAITNSDGAAVFFYQNSTAQDAIIINYSGSGTGFNDLTKAGNSHILNDSGFTGFSTNSSAENSEITNENGGFLQFSGHTTADHAKFINNDGGIEFVGNTTAANATIINGELGYTLFEDSATAGNSTVITKEGGSVSFLNHASGGNAILINDGDVEFNALVSTGTTVGSIAGSGSMELGAVTLIVGGNNLSTVYSGDINDSGGLIKIGTGTLTLSGLENSYTGLTRIKEGAIHLTGELTSGAWVEAGGLLSGNGRLGGLVNHGIVRPGVAGAGQLSVTSYSGSGLLDINFNGRSHTSLKVSGNANVTGGTLSIAGNDFTIGQYDVINAGSVTGAFSTVNIPSSAFLDFSTHYTPTAIQVWISFAEKFASVAQNGNQLSVANALDVTKSGATPNFINAVNAVALLSAAEARDAFSQIGGDSLASFQNVAMVNTSAFMGIMQSRGTTDRSIQSSRVSPPIQLAFAGVADTLESTGSPVYAPVYGLWTRGIGFFNKIDGDSSVGSPGSHSNTGGFQMGYDFPLTEYLVLGFSGGYAATSLTVDDRLSSGNSTAIQSGAYTRYTQGPWYLDGGLAYTASSNEMTRSLLFPGINMNAHSNFQSDIYSLALEAGYTFKARKIIFIQPSVAIHQSHVCQDAFTETGADGFNLSVAEQKSDSYVSVIGTRLNRIFNDGAAHPYTLGLHAAWAHELGSIDNSLTADFAQAPGSPFHVQATPRSRNAALIGVEGHITVTQSLELFTSYSATLSPEQTGHGLLGGFRLKW